MVTTLESADGRVCLWWRMPFTSAGPSDVPGYVDAYSQTVQAIIDLGQTCRPDDFERPTDCPGWTVKDVIAHVVGLETFLETHEIPAVFVPAYDHIRSDIGRFTEIHVEERRGVPGPEVVEELVRLLPLRQAALYGVADLDEEVSGAFGPAPFESVMRMRTLDIWTHEQDIREALGRIGDLDTPAAGVAIRTLASGLPRVVARVAGVPVGNAVIFDITGPLVGRVGVRVVDRNGRAVGIPLFSGTAAGTTEDAIPTTITISSRAFARRAAGRGGVDDVHWTAQGDLDVARRVMEHLAVTP